MKVLVNLGLIAIGLEGYVLGSIINLPAYSTVIGLIGKSVLFAC